MRYYTKKCLLPNSVILFLLGAALTLHIYSGEYSSRTMAVKLVGCLIYCVWCGNIARCPKVKLKQHSELRRDRAH